MEKYIPILQEMPLFDGVENEEIASLLSCLNARRMSYPKEAYVLRQGDILRDILVLVAGRLHIQKDDYWGNRSILTPIGVGEMFGEAYAASKGDVLNRDVVAVEDSVVIALNVERVLTTCSSACRFHTLVVRNLFFAMAQKNRKLVQKLDHLSERTIREKVMSYLSEEAKRHGNARFLIPFNRQQLADYLSVDRSALSNQLCHMRDEGLLSFYKNTFELH